MSRVDPDHPELAAVANWLRLISHPSRLAIALLLLDGAAAVSEIETALGLRQPNLSQHLGVLRDSQMLSASRHAKSVVYELVDGPSLALIKAIHASMQTPSASKDNAMASANGESARSPSGPDMRADKTETDDAAMFAHVVRRV